MKQKFEPGGIRLHPGPAGEAGRFAGLAAWSGLPGAPEAAAVAAHPDELRV